MKRKYYVNNNAQSNGDHEMHREDCRYLPSLANRKYLGKYLTCYEAVLEAKKHHDQVNGCIYCSKPCHTQ